MANVFITGSTQGLGLMGGCLLREEGHCVVFHARNEATATALRSTYPEIREVLVADVSTLSGMLDLAQQANHFGRFDAVIHNAGLGFREPDPGRTEDGLSRLWAVNVLAPYVLTATMTRPDRLIFMGSGMHERGDPDLDDLQWTRRAWNAIQAYCDSKYQDLQLAFAMARHMPGVRVNAVSPGWVATRMGGEGARDDLAQGHLTQAWLAVGVDTLTRTSGGYFYHKALIEPLAETRDPKSQDQLLSLCETVSGIRLGLDTSE